MLAVLVSHFYSRSLCVSLTFSRSLHSFYIQSNQALTRQSKTGTGSDHYKLIRRFCSSALKIVFPSRRIRKGSTGIRICIFFSVDYLNPFLNKFSHLDVTVDSQVIVT